MKKRFRFSLLTKVVLLTGSTIFLTTASTLTITTIIDYQDSEAQRIKDSQTASDYAGIIFEQSDENFGLLVEMQTIVWNRYSEIADTFESITQLEYQDYLDNLNIELFGPDPESGAIGGNPAAINRRLVYNEIRTALNSATRSRQIDSTTVFLIDPQYNRQITLVNLIQPMAGQISYLDSQIVNAIQNRNYYVTFNNANRITTLNTVESSDKQIVAFTTVNKITTEIDAAFRRTVLFQILVTLGIAVGLMILFGLLTKFLVIRNIKKLSRSTTSFIEKLDADEPLDLISSNVKSRDEIRELSEDFDHLQEHIIHYVNTLEEKQAIEQKNMAELLLAKRIQLESLPKDFFLFKDNEIRSVLKTAKEVGGDFYDYFVIDKNRLGIVIADVSGKGVPAALFMMKAKESIRNALYRRVTIEEAIGMVNTTLSLNNTENYFVTAFIAILDTDTNKLTYVSAGHERPYLVSDNKAKRIECNSNIVLGIAPDFEFEKGELDLKAGDHVLFYTDGLNEAINSNTEEFGYNRIAASLSKKAKDNKEMLSNLMTDFNEFVGSAEQFDDLTLVLLQLKKDTLTLEYKNAKYEDIENATNKCEEYLEGYDIKKVSKIGIIIDEVFNNIISYSGVPNIDIYLKVEKVSEEKISLYFIDKGKHFDPTLTKKRTVQQNLEEGRVGGLGITIVKNLASDIEYLRDNDSNILIISL